MSKDFNFVIIIIIFLVCILQYVYETTQPKKVQYITMWAICNYLWLKLTKWEQIEKNNNKIIYK